MDDLVKKLRSQIGDDVQQVYSHEALFRLAAARIAALDAALKPLLRGQVEPGPHYSDQSHVLLSVTLGDIRRARAALEAGQ